MPSVTTTIRLPKRLKLALARKAAATERGVNWLIVRAIEQYLQPDQQDLALEARRQSLLASASEGPAEDGWEALGVEHEDWQP